MIAWEFNSQAISGARMSRQEILRGVYPEPFVFAQDRLRRRVQNDG
jgi:hypothetical protein